MAHLEGIQPGDQFGELAVIEFAGRNQNSQTLWEVRCTCGSISTVLGTNLKRGNTTQCNSGLHRAFHGGVGTPEYNAWRSMRWRCNPRNKRCYPLHIQVCPEWLRSFDAFLAHIGPMPTPGLEVDRKNNNAGYEPGNVRWATRSQQMRNTSLTRLLTINGITKPEVEWAETSGISVATLRYRVNRKWPEGELLSADKWKHRRGRCA
jgi:hypothetical protein